jgi:ATP:corrinoid adenosyltransferase
MTFDKQELKNDLNGMSDALATISLLIQDKEYDIPPLDEYAILIHMDCIQGHIHDIVVKL